MGEDAARKRRRSIEDAATPVGGQPVSGKQGGLPRVGVRGRKPVEDAEPVIPVEEAGDGAGDGAGQRGKARPFTTAARGGTSWADSGGLSLRRQRGQAREAEAVKDSGEGQGLPVPKLPGPRLPTVPVDSSGESGETESPERDESPSYGLPGPVLPSSGGQVGRRVSADPVMLPSSGGVLEGESVESVESGGSSVEVSAAGSGSGLGFLGGESPPSLVEVGDDWDEVEDSEDEVVERRQRVLAASSKRGIRITPRDLRIIRFAARYRFVAHHQLARYEGMSDKAASIRLHKLAEGRIMHKVEVTYGRNVWTPTADGVAVADVDMPGLRPQDISLSTMGHELGLVNLGIELELGGENILKEEGWPRFNRMSEESDEMLSGERVLTTRELRQAAMRFRKGVTRHEIMSEYQARMDDWDGNSGYPSPELIPGNEGMFVMHSDEFGDHQPDMVVMRDRLPDGSPQSVAIELELSRKPERELIRILRNFKDSMLFDKLYYFCHRKAVMLALKRVNDREVGIPDSKFQVLRYVPTRSNEPFWG